MVMVLLVLYRTVICNAKKNPLATRDKNHGRGEVLLAPPAA